MPRFSLPFTKMQGLGNDFVIVGSKDLPKSPDSQEPVRHWRQLAPLLARVLCDRHHGIGADGLILVVGPADKGILGYPQAEACQVGWVYTNSDGSSSDMCGNGLRCLASWSMERQYVTGSRFAVSTARGPVEVLVNSKDEITVDIGAPILSAEAIPLSAPKMAQFINQPVIIDTSEGELALMISCVSMGNPHCVIFSSPTIGFPFDDHDDRNFIAVARAIQKMPLFPEGVNVELATIVDSNEVRVCVFERGSGLTMACASGAAAVVVAGVLEERLGRQAVVVLPGGSLTVDWSLSDGHVRLTGPATEVYRGEVDLFAFKELGSVLKQEAVCS